MLHILNNFKDEEESLYDDHSERIIFQYIDNINSFISNYGYDKAISKVKSKDSIEDIENTIREFLISNANAWNHLEIFGTLKDYPDKDIYVCCYEPYGEEVLCVEKRNNKLFFFDTSKYKYGIQINDINYFNLNPNIF